MTDKVKVKYVGPGEERTMLVLASEVDDLTADGLWVVAPKSTAKQANRKGDSDA